MRVSLGVNVGRYVWSKVSMEDEYDTQTHPSTHPPTHTQTHPFRYILCLNEEKKRVTVVTDITVRNISFIQSQNLTYKGRRNTRITIGNPEITNLLINGCRNDREQL